MRILYVLVVIVMVVCCAGASTVEEEALALESMDLMDAIKLGTPETRAQAVATLVGLRDHIESVLVDAVTQANEGQAEAGIKGGAIYVLGKLGCVSGRDLLEAEEEFFWAPGPPEGFHGGGANISRYGGVGIWALENAGFSDKVRVERMQSPPVSLNDFPMLQTALVDMYSTDLRTREHAQNTLLLWDSMICKGLLSILDARHRDLYASDARIAAVFLLGEFRTTLAAEALLKSAGLTDPENIRSGFPQRLKPDSGTSDYPAIDAMRKIARRLPLGSAVWTAFSLTQRSPAELSGDDRERVMKCFVEIDPQLVSTQIAHNRKGYEKLSEAQMTDQGLTEEARQGALQFWDEWCSLVPTDVQASE